jgi:hypothetical protein
MSAASNARLMTLSVDRRGSFARPSNIREVLLTPIEKAPGGPEVPAGQALSFNKPTCVSATPSYTPADRVDTPVATAGGLGQRKAAAARTAFGAGHVLDYRRGRLHRIEPGGAPQRGRARRCRRVRLLGCEGKWRNLQKRRLADFVASADLAGWLPGRKLDAVFHLGAISETTASDGDLVIATNFRLPLMLLDWCTAAVTPFIYASSAATYGDGESGFADDNSLEALTRLKR